MNNSKRRFNINEYNNSVVMHCANPEEALHFEQILDECGMTTFTGQKYSGYLAKNYCTETGICYRFASGLHGSLAYYRHILGTHLNEILEYSDFDWGDRPTVVDFCFDDFMKGRLQDEQVQT